MTEVYFVRHAEPDYGKSYDFLRGYEFHYKVMTKYSSGKNIEVKRVSINNAIYQFL